MTDVLLERGDLETDIQGACEHADGLPKAWGVAWSRSPLIAPRRNHPTDALILDFQALGLRDSREHSAG